MTSADIALALADLSRQVGEVAGRVEYAVDIAEETREFAKATNGRVNVHDLALHEIAVRDRTRRDERAKAAAKAAARATASEMRRIRRTDRLVTAVTGLGVATFAWVLAQLIG